MIPAILKILIGRNNYNNQTKEMAVFLIDFIQIINLSIKSLNFNIQKNMNQINALSFQAPVLIEFEIKKIK